MVQFSRIQTYRQLVSCVGSFKLQNLTSASSMELVQLGHFRQPSLEQKKTSYLNEKGSTNSKTEKPKIVCATFSSENQTLTCGLTDGNIIQFVNQKFNSKKLTESKEYEVRKFSNLANTHKGEIKCILSEVIFSNQQVFIITGSADRTVKIWDTEPKTKNIVQTLSGHTNTVLCLIYSKKSDTLFSGSVDKTVRVWKQDEGRKFFMYPWYVNYQVIADFSPKKGLVTDKPVYPTTFELQDGEINNFVLYLGDSGGNLHIIKQYEIEPSPYSYSQQESSERDQASQKIRVGFQIEKSNYRHHRLAVNCIKYVPKEHLVVSSGYDQFLYGFESLSEKLTLKYPNPKKCLFTSIINVNNLLMASDEQGSFYCLELSSDKGVEEIKKYDGKINQIFANKGEIFTVTDEAVDVFRVVRGIKTVEGQNCHTDSIVGIYALEAYKLTDRKVRDQVKVISVSLDNTLRVWDPADLTCLQVMQNPEKAQISSLFYLKRANLFVTGHENGIVRLWNIELQTSITISQQNTTFAHKNNICAFTEYIYVRGNEDITEYMFSTGYEGKVNVWEIFLKKTSVQSSLISSSICPQLKNTFMPDDDQQSPDKIGFELFALQIWEGRCPGKNLVSKRKEERAMSLKQPALKNKKSEQEREEEMPVASDSEKQITILSAGTKGYVFFTKMFTYETYHKEKLHDDSIMSMLIDANILFTGSCDHSIKLTNLGNMEKLNVLYAHEATISQIAMIEQTGHLMTQSTDGEILFWNYPIEQIVKKIKDKKQTIMCTCYIDQSQMMYVGSGSNKILTFSLADLYDNPANQSSRVGRGAEDEFSEESLEKMLWMNEQQLREL